MKYLSFTGLQTLVTNIKSLIVQASASVAGIMKLYTSTGSNTDGTMTQKAITDALSSGGGGSLQNWETSITSSSAGQMSITVPGYRSDMVIFAFMNGLLLEVTTEYTVSSSGVVTTVNSMNSNQTMTVRALWIE